MQIVTEVSYPFLSQGKALIFHTASENFCNCIGFPATVFAISNGITKYLIDLPLLVSKSHVRRDPN